MTVMFFFWSAISVFTGVNAYAFVRISCIRRSFSVSAENTSLISATWSPHHILGEAKMKEFALIKEEEMKKKAAEIEKYATILKKEYANKMAALISEQLLEGEMDEVQLSEIKEKNIADGVVAVLEKGIEVREEEKRVELKKKLRKKKKRE
jgi:hypothetical protein